MLLVGDKSTRNECGNMGVRYKDFNLRLVGNIANDYELRIHKMAQCLVLIRKFIFPGEAVTSVTAFDMWFLTGGRLEVWPFEHTRCCSNIYSVLINQNSWSLSVFLSSQNSLV